MISVDEALSRVLALVDVLEAETLPLDTCGGRVLALPVAARRTQPPFDASAMDGYAVRRADARPGARLLVTGEAAAGSAYEGSVGAGETVRIFTGAPMPRGADHVVIQEDVTREGDRIIVATAVEPASHVRASGSDFSAGDMVAPGLLTPSRIALIAAMNVAELPVVRRPVVALIATGDELVMPGEEPAPSQIVASNGLGLAAMLRAAGAVARHLPIARDTRASLHQALELARDADLVVTIGGASVGDHDLVAAVMRDAGMSPAFYKVAMRPGKPLMAGRLGAAAMLGLPGNPVSSMVCGHVFVVPTVRAMLGLGRGPAPRRTGRLAAPLPGNGAREHYMRARLATDGLRAFERQDSALLSVLAEADALIVRPPHDPPREAGAEVTYLPFG